MLADARTMDEIKKKDVLAYDVVQNVAYGVQYFKSLSDAGQ